MLFLSKGLHRRNIPPCKPKNKRTPPRIQRQGSRSQTLSQQPSRRPNKILMVNIAQKLTQSQHKKNNGGNLYQQNTKRRAHERMLR